MGLFGLFEKTDINEGVKLFGQTKGAVLLDVRSPEEYNEGHIPGALNVDVNQIGQVAGKVPDKASPVFVYCLSGARSGRAVGAMKKMGYTNVQSIGGIQGYKGKLEMK